MKKQELRRLYHLQELSIDDLKRMYDEYANTLKRLDKIQDQVNANDKLASAKNVDRVAKETGKAESEIIEGIAKEKERLEKEARQERQKEATDYYNKGNAKPGSLAAKARMVEQYNDKCKK
jgi:YidC/Oxa1 family membrane protein insertase